MATSRRASELRDALATLVSSGAVPGAVRPEIGASWHRSVEFGLRPETFTVPHDGDADGDGRLVRAARAVLDQLSEDLSTTRLGVVLTDDRGQVLARRAADHAVHDRLDRIQLAPGFVYAEAEVGTNAIGTALQEARPSLVDGREHFADALTAMTCAASPIVDPRDGRTLGVVDLTCNAIDGSPLMLPLVRRAAADIEHHLARDPAAADPRLLARFVRDRTRMKGPFVLINERTMLLSAAATGVVDRLDQDQLWDRALELLTQPDAGRVLQLGNGPVAIVTCEPIVDGGELVGVSLRLGHGDGPPEGMHEGGRSRTPFGWGSLTETERRVIDLVCEGLTNREVGGRLFMSPHTVGSHLRSIFRKLDVNSRVDLTRLAVQQQR